MGITRYSDLQPRRSPAIPLGGGPGHPPRAYIRSPVNPASAPVPAAPDAPVLSVERLTKRFGGLLALDGCTLDIAAGSITGLIGPNGAGKSTLFDVVAGFQAADSGRVLLEGHDISHLAPVERFRRGLVRTFQTPREFEKLTVLESLMLVPAGQSGETVWNAWLHWRQVQVEERRLRQEAKEVLAILHLADQRDQYAGNLSGGQKKLLELGRAMMARSGVVLLDEPGAGVNPTLMGTLLEVLRRINRDHGYTFCIIEHDLDLIADLCDPVMVMAGGRVLACGTMDEVRSNADVIEAYLGRPDRGTENDARG